MTTIREPASRVLRVAAIQMESVAADLHGNIEKILDAIRGAVAADADVLITPEMALTGYAIGDLLGDNAFLTDVELAVSQVCNCLFQAAPNLTLLLGAPVRERWLASFCPGWTPTDTDHLDANRRQVHNALLVIRGGVIVAARSKTLLPTYSVFDDARWVIPGSDHSLIEIAGVPVGLAVCEDLWTPAIANHACELGAKVLLVANASPFEVGKQKVRQDLVSDTAAGTGMPVVYVNSVGGQDELVFDGGSIAVDADGCVAAGSPMFEPDLLVVDIQTFGRVRFADEAKNLGWQYPTMPAQQQMWSALVTALRSYTRTCGFSSVIIGLSGGLDSAVAAALAVDALGADNVWGIGMPGPYSSSGSVDDARDLATNLGVRFNILPITDTNTDEHAILGDLLDGPGSSVARENIQARLRALHLMTLANAHNSMVINTGNKSESAVGYFTLGGDSSGGFALLKDLYKTEVYKLAEWRNRQEFIAGRPPLIPENTITKPPSAELAADQVDTNSLPPYPVLDRILRDYLEHVQSADEIANHLVRDHGYTADDARTTVLRILGMVDRAEHKRRQVAPGPRVTAKSFGFDRRMPVAARRTHRSTPGAVQDPESLFSDEVWSRTAQGRGAVP